ncbi:radical SAM protein [Paraburkholderia sp. IMGN_8]|uniref:radical SAM protein n=1 Tax=Paraburkholderia sp. IMGN_8 TaxID=3136564 RepID=UPI003100C218
MKILDVSTSKDQGCKYLITTENLLESVESTFFLYGEEKKPYLCISSQFGCAVGCIFCETGKQKSMGDLGEDQIIQQVTLCLDDARRRYHLHEFDTVLFAGMGEPMLNMKQVCRASTRIKAEGLAKRVTLTTVGISNKFNELNQTSFDALSISLHATTDEVRKFLIPVSSQCNIEELVVRARDYHKKRNAKIYFNYLLLDGVNDTDSDLKRLCSMFNGDSFVIKLKYLNKVESSNGVYLNPSNRFELFKDTLKSRGIECVIDQSIGVDVLGGCGQLRSKSRVMRRMSRH